jgi:hypothetical protein
VVKLQPIELPSTLRYWRDLSTRRLLLGLALAPIFPIAIPTILLAAPFGVFPLLVGSLILVAACTWSVIAGGVYLLVTAYTREVLGRSECVLMGAVAGFTLPMTVSWASRVWLQYFPERHTCLVYPFCSDVPVDSLAAIGIVMAPFGALGGWVMWQVGVRPAATSAADFQSAFD